jgi:hypothetical membrane protein
MRGKAADSLASGAKESDARRTGSLFVFGGLLFLLLTTAAEAIYPNFSLQVNSMSDLAATTASTTVVEETAIIGLSVCWMVGAYYLYRNTGRRGLLVLNVVPGAAFLLAGLSPENVNIVLHSIGALLGFPVGAVAAVLSYRVIKTSFRFVAAALGALSLAATLVTFLGERVVGPCGTCTGDTPSYLQSLHELVLGLGGWESMIVYPLMIWLIGFGSYLLGLGGAGETAR